MFFEMEKLCDINFILIFAQQIRWRNYHNKLFLSRSKQKASNLSKATGVRKGIGIGIGSE